MAHRAQQEFIESARDVLPEFFTGKRVLEVGSLDINGSVRRYFERCDYTGIDVAPGPGVDVVCQGQDFAAADATFDVVISTEAMEHNPYWQETFRNMLRLCRPGGMILMTCATSGRPEHGTPRSDPHASPLTLGIGWDYYRNLTHADFMGAVELAKMLSGWRFLYNHAVHDLYFVGVRKGDPLAKDLEANLSRLERKYRTFNLVHWTALRHRVLISLLGEHRYRALPELSWRSVEFISHALWSRMTRRS
jgi:SAM-dependent methyltransferase